MSAADAAPTPDFDAIVVGAGHNGLVTAAYLAQAGLSTLLIEARDAVGGTAASEQFGGATVNICNCDHLTFRTTPVMNELNLASFGLEYFDVDPPQHNFSWSSAEAGHGWSHHHDLEATLDDLGAHFPGQVAGYRRYAAAAMPAVEMIFDAAAEPPSARGLTRLALRRRFHGVPTIMRWSRAISRRSSNTATEHASEAVSMASSRIVRRDASGRRGVQAAVARQAMRLKRLKSGRGLRSKMLAGSP